MSENSLIVDDDILPDGLITPMPSGGGPLHQSTRRVRSIGVLLLPHHRQNSKSITFKSFLHSLRVRSGMVAREAKIKLGARLSLPEAELANYGLLRIDLDSNSTFPTRYILHTLCDDEILIDDEREEGIAAAGNKGEEGEQRSFTRWFFKDSCSSPLTLSDGELSGQESPDDGDSYGSATTVQLYPLRPSFGGDVVKAGWLLKLSTRDPNLWRKRWCEMTESRLWVLSQRPNEDGIPKKQRRSFWLPLCGNTVDEGGTKEPKYCIKVVCASKAYVFRATSKDEQLSWVTSLRKCIRIAADNYYIQAAESIICGEEYNRCVQMNKTAKEALSLYDVTVYVSFAHNDKADNMTATPSTFWRAAGLSYLRLAAISTSTLRNALKEPARTAALAKEDANYTRYIFQDGKPGNKAPVNDLSAASKDA